MQGIDLPDWGSFEPVLEKLRGELTKNAFDKRCCSTALRRRTLRHSLRSERSGKLKLDRYVYCERPTSLWAEQSASPPCMRIGKYVRSHPRHFRQRSDYTICAGFDESKAGW
jgi:hypothetical protein